MIRSLFDSGEISHPSQASSFMHSLGQSIGISDVSRISEIRLNLCVCVSFKNLRSGHEWSNEATMCSPPFVARSNAHRLPVICMETRIVHLWVRGKDEEMKWHWWFVYAKCSVQITNTRTGVNWISERIRFTFGRHICWYRKYVSCQLSLHALSVVEYKSDKILYSGNYKI